MKTCKKCGGEHSDKYCKPCKKVYDAKKYTHHPKDITFRHIEKHCVICSALLTLKNNRDVARKIYCSESCKGKGIRGHIRFATNKTCILCGKLFDATGTTQYFCSNRCCSGYHIKTTTKQYDRITGRWDQYLNRLCHGKKRPKLNRDILLELLEKQGFRCAISGVLMTCDLQSGTVSPTNASIDRKSAGGQYSVDNIQLVCRQANIMKWTLSETDLLWWCETILLNKGG